MTLATARRLLTVFAIVGLAASAAATWVHVRLIRNPDYTSFCDVNSTVTCKQAYLSAYGSLGGVSVALYGLFFFALILILVWAGGRSEKLRETVVSYVLLLSTAAMAFVLYLAYASFFILKSVCPLCLVTYISVAGILTVAALSNAAPLFELPRRALRDLGALLTNTSASVITVVFLAVAIWAAMAFPTPHERPVSVLQPLPQDQRVELERWFDVQPKVDVPYSAEGAKVLIVKFNDYQCPPCRATYFAYEPVLAKYKDRPKDVKFLLKHFPLDVKCNPSITGSAHPAACDAAAAAVMARATGTFDKLTDWFYLHQDELSPSIVRRAAAEIGGISDFDARYSAAIEEVRADATTGGKLGVGSTPTFFINGRKIPSVTTAALDALIEIELKRQP
jgi:uncharacterized membrane protein/protein-disulfide isomerase